MRTIGPARAQRGLLRLLPCMNALQPSLASQPGFPAQTTQRRFGPFGLKRLLGRSSLTMAWLAEDSRSMQDVLLMLPRRASSAGAEGLKRALDAARRAARIDHPRLQAPSEIGQYAGWLYVACQPRQGAQTLGEWLNGRAEVSTALDVASWCSDVLDGLAAAHDAGLAHGDVGLHSLLIDRAGRVIPWGLAVVAPPPLAEGGAASDRDVLGVGLLMHQLLSGAPPLGEADLPSVLGRLAREPVRLPTTLPQPVPEVLAAIVDRATATQASRRYLSARSLFRAVDEWRQNAAEGRANVLAILLARSRAAGHLPALPGLAARVSKVVGMDSEPLQSVVELILEDPALALELLRQLNTAAQRAPDADPVTSVGRAVQLIGLRGVRRAAGALRPWPGLLPAAQAAPLRLALLRARQVSLLARLLAPVGLPLDMVSLAAQLQQFGRLLALYHFPDEAAQIAALMRPAPRVEEGDEQPEPEPDEALAARLVIGVELPALGRAVLRQWGADQGLELLATPLGRDQAVRVPQQAPDWVRLVASCAGETLDAWQRAGPAVERELEHVAARYARTLDVKAVDLRSAAERSQLQTQNALRQEADSLGSGLRR